MKILKYILAYFSKPIIGWNPIKKGLRNEREDQERFREG